MKEWRGLVFQICPINGTGYLESWVYYVVQSVINVNEGVTEEHGMADLFQQQIDVSGVHN